MSKEKWGVYMRRAFDGGRLTKDEKIALWERIEQSTDVYPVSLRRSSRRVPRLIAAASVAAAIAIVSLLLWTARTDSHPPIARIALNSQYLLADTGAVRLTMANQLTVVMGDSGVIDLTKNPAPSESSAQFSTLTVPYGKRSEVILSDGSKVWLNAGSQLTFPEQFNDSQREVYLEGEGYFDVAHDTARPFVVYASDLKINVLGTSFNVSSYRDDAFASAVLLSGKIELEAVGQHKFENQVLEPGNLAILSKERKQLTIQQDNASDHISWKQRQLVLKSTPLADLLVKLERVYNTEIEDKTGTFSGDTFSGRLDMRQPLLEVLESIYDRQRCEIIKKERRIVIQTKKPTN